MANNPKGKNGQTSEELSQAGAKGQQARKKRSNRWLHRREEKDREAIRQRIQVDMICAKLERAAKGEIDLSPTQVQAAKVLLDKTLPSLQAVEQTQMDAPATEEEIMAQLHSLLANPGTRAQIQAMLAGVPMAVDGDVQSQQTLSGDNKQVA